MTTQIQFVNANHNPRLERMLDEGLKKLNRKYAWIISARAILKAENYVDSNNHLCEIELSVPGPNIFTKETADNFEAAIAGALEELEVLLKKHKDRMYRH
ncbi:MAG: hypothetical protein KatS3mg029_0362 [Saprospiraceae bacterium]|jgi:putative sigma-54 modulation protein|nr:MAG: hypothetical protein KatS3mg029_0362 [Saprospiraceae bacterium]